MSLDKQVLLVLRIVSLIIGAIFIYTGYYKLKQAGYEKLYNPIMFIVIGAIFFLLPDL